MRTVHRWKVLTAAVTTLLPLVLTSVTARAQDAVPSAARAGVSEVAHFDVLLRGGRVLDGSGSAWARADVGIRGDRIVAVGDLRGATAATTIDARDLYVAPGFIDTHSHSGEALQRAELRGAQSLVAQGI